MTTESKEGYLLGAWIEESSPLGQLYVEENRLWAETPAGDLFHYTNAAGLNGILSSRSLWSSHAGFLNDLSEIGYARQLIIDVLRDFTASSTFELLDELSKDDFAELFVLADDGVMPFITSFCENGDQLSQWRGYASLGQGFSVGFDLGAINKTTSGHNYLRKVIYDPVIQRDRLTNLLAKWLFVCKFGLSKSKGEAGYVSRFDSIWTLKNILLDYHFCLKHRSFEEEKEWRLVRLVDFASRRSIALAERERIEEVAAGTELRPDNVDNEASIATQRNTEVLEEIKFRSTDFGIIPFVEQKIRGVGGEHADRFPVTKIIVGPTPFTAHQCRSVDLFRSLKPEYYRVTVLPSEIPLR